MRLLLVNPVRPDDRELYGFTTPPIGLSYLAATASEAGHDVDAYDMQIPDNGLAELIETVQRTSYDAICMTMTSHQFPSARRIRERLSELCPDALFVAGGPHSTVRPEMVLRLGGFDVAVVGEGELTLIDLLAHHEAGRFLGQVPGICWVGSAGEVRRTPRRPRIRDLDALPFPELRAFGFPERYSQFSLVSSRGCPGCCSFCATRAIWGDRVVAQSPGRTLGELRRASEELGCAEIVFVDDTMNADARRFSRLLDGLVDLARQIEAPFTWSMWSRVDTGRITDWRRAYEAGCRAVSFGVESGSPAILDRMAKGVRIEDVAAAVAAAHEAGIRVKTEWIVGLPGSFEEQLESIELMRHLQPDWIQVHALVPLPGTPLGDNPEEFGIAFEEARLLEEATVNRLAPEDVLRFDYLPRARMVELLARMEDELRKLGYVTPQEAKGGDKVLHTPSLGRPESPLL